MIWVTLAMLGVILSSVILVWHYQKTRKLSYLVTATALTMSVVLALTLS